MVFHLTKGGVININQWADFETILKAEMIIMAEHNTQKAMSDDYSLIKVPREKRTMGWLSITNIAFGIATAIFYFQMGSVMALKFGAINAIISSVYAIIVAGILGTFISYLSAKSGMNVNFLSRGGGFGYVGASLTSFIYATNFIMYCAFEGLILVSAVHTFFPVIPEWAIILFFGTVVIPLNWFGIKQLDKLQKWSVHKEDYIV
jgi:purine-cytosine permease-like protein